MGLSEDRTCGVCQKEIQGQAMKAKNRLYHEETCFKCSACSKDLKDICVYFKDEQLFCEEHYKAKYVPKCAKCNEYITEVSGNIYTFMLSYG